MVFTPPEVSVLLCSSRFGVDWEVAKEVIISDLITRGYVKVGKVIGYTKFVPTDKAGRAYKMRVLRRYELKLLEELGKKGIYASDYMEGMKGFKSLKYMDELIEWSQREGLVRLEKGRWVGKYLLTGKGEGLAGDWRKRLERLQDMISEAHSSSEEQGRRVMGRYLPWVRIMRHVVPKERRPSWMKRGPKEKLFKVLQLASAFVPRADLGFGVSETIAAISAEKAVKYLKPEDAGELIESGGFNEDEELKIYYPNAYSPPAERSKMVAEGRFCINCGQRIPADARFCPKCGSRIEE